MTLQELRYFEAASRLNNISRAAEELHISQPSVSTAIHNLEVEFGVTLIQRHYRGFSLTNEGAALLNLAEGLLNHADQVHDHMCMLGHSRYPVRLGVPPMTSTFLLPILYREFSKAYPEILLVTKEMGAKQLLHDLRENILDIAFLTHDVPLPHTVNSVPITPIEAVWCTNQYHSMADRQSISIDELENERIVSFLKDSFFQDAINKQFELAGIAPTFIHSTGQLSTIITMISSGAATGFMLSPIASFSPDLVAHRINPPITVQLSFAWNGTNNSFHDLKTCVSFFRTSAFLQDLQDFCNPSK